MTAIDYAIIMAAFGLAQGLVEVIKLMVLKLNRRNGNNKPANIMPDFRAIESKIDALRAENCNSEEVKRKLLVVADILSYKDADGIPFCYTPRNLVKLSERTLEKLDVVISLITREHK